jgi:predicted nucleic acid-binding protein
VADEKRPVAVTDTSPIVALAGIGQLHLLEQLFDSILVPSTVWGELTDKPDAAEPDLLAKLANVSMALDEQVIPQAMQDLLHPGEQQAIAIALRRNACVLLDDGDARKYAASVGLQVIGTLRILIQAKREGLFDVVGPLLHRLRENRFRLSDALVSQVLALV